MGMLTNATKQLLDNPNFVKWFGNSVVKDKAGIPLTVYHGSPNKAIDAFDFKKIGTSTDDGVLSRGFYFDDAEDIAKFYGRDGGSVTEAVLKIQNPLVVKDIDNYKNNAGLWKTEALIDAIRKKYPNEKLKNYTYDEALQWLEKEPSSVNSEITDLLIKKGHDGVSFNGEYVVFDPKQIKSPSNRGTFDPTDPNILKGLVGAGMVGSALAPSKAEAMVGKKPLKQLEQEQALQEPTFDPTALLAPGGLMGNVAGEGIGALLKYMMGK